MRLVKSTPKAFSSYHLNIKCFHHKVRFHRQHRHWCLDDEIQLSKMSHNEKLEKCSLVLSTI